MRYVAAILFLIMSLSLSPQKADVKSVEAAVAAFDKALLGKDSSSLKSLLSDKLNYGHSNGWIQTKRNVIDDLYNGKLVYQKINAQTPEVVMEGSTAAARMQADIDVLLDGKPMQFRLKVLQVWVSTNKHWKLLARQSVKV